MTRTRQVAVSICELLTSSAVGLRGQTSAAAALAASTGQRALMIDVDNLQTIDDAVVAAIIAALRIMHDSGGSIQVLTNREAHVHSLRCFGLDRIVAMARSDNANQLPTSTEKTLQNTSTVHTPEEIMTMLDRGLTPITNNRSALIDLGFEPAQPKATRAHLAALWERTLNLGYRVTERGYRQVSIRQRAFLGR
jgi:anti-anti-sigma regulatory factor